MSPIRLTLSSDADLVGAVPYLLGFRPEDSVTLLTAPMVPGGRSAGPTVRLDLDDAGASGSSMHVDLLVDRLARQDYCVYGVVVHVTEPLATARHRARVRSAVARVRAADGSRVGAWIVAGDGWERLPGHDPFADRPGPRPLAEIESARSAAELVLAGLAPAAGREDLAVPREPDCPDGSRLAAALGAEPDRVRDPDAGVAAYRALVGRRPDGSEGARTEEEIGLLARLLVGIESIPVRDAVLTLAIDPGSPLTGAGVGLDLVDELWAGGPMDVAAGRAPLEAIAALAPSGQAAPALAVLAFLAWRRGEGARAAVLAEQALDDRPGYSLADLVLDLQASGMPPPELGTGRAGSPGSAAAGPLPGTPDAA